MAAVLAQSYAQDAHEFLPMLASFLEALMPDETEIEYKSLGWFSGKKRVVGLKLSIDDRAYHLHEDEHGKALEARRLKIVRGVTLKTEPIAVAIFLEDLSEQLAEKTRQNEQALAALKVFLKQ